METIMQAIGLLESGQTDEAIRLLKSFTPLASDDEKLTVAQVYMQWGFLQEAVDLLQNLRLSHPENSEVKLLLADIYIELNDDKAAINLLNDIDPDDPSYVQALLQLADLYQAEGLFEVTEQKLLEAKNLMPEEPVIDFALGEFYFSMGNYKKSIIYYEKLYKQKKEFANVSIDSRLAEAHAAIGEYEIALKYFKKLNSSHPDVLFKYGLTAYYADRKDISIRVWNKVIEIDPYYHTVYYELAKAYRDEEMIQEAYETCQEGLRIDEYNKELLYLAGVLAHQLNEYEECITLIEKAIELDPDYKEAIIYMVELYKTDEEFEKIIELIERIKQVGATDPLYEWELAKAYRELGDPKSDEKALTCYEEAYHMLENDPDFLKDYGYFLAEIGRIADAVTMLEAYLKHEPADVEIEEYLMRLKEL